MRSTWFQVYQVDPGVYAIYEPHQWEEVISYLIVGNDRALLFDTGMGIADIRAVAEQLTRLPIEVMNSHTHPDHIGDNWEFDRILGLDTQYTRDNAGGYSHAAVAGEVAADHFCAPPPAGFDTASYRTRPFHITQIVADGSVIGLGSRQLAVLHIPGTRPMPSRCSTPSMGSCLRATHFTRGLSSCSPEGPTSRRSRVRQIGWRHSCLDCASS